MGFLTACLVGVALFPYWQFLAQAESHRNSRTQAQNQEHLQTIHLTLLFLRSLLTHRIVSVFQLRIISKKKMNPISLNLFGTLTSHSNSQLFSDSRRVF